MRRDSFLPLAVFATAALATAPALAQGSPPDPRQIADSTENKWVTNYNAGNAAGIAALFAPDGTYALSTGAVLSGPQAIQDGVAARVKAGWTKIATTVSDAHTSGDAVWWMGDFTVTGSGPNAGKQITGHYAKVLTRDGADWRIRLLMSNLVPPAAPPPPK